MPLSHQRGVVTLIAVLLLLALVGMVLAMGLHIAGTDVSDSASQNQSIEALMLAESALERQGGRLANGATCSSLSPDTGSPFTFGSGSFNLVSAVPSGSLCQVRVSGTVGKVTRTVDGWYSGGGGAITLETRDSRFNTSAVNTLSVPLTIGGPGRVLVVGVTVDSAAGSAVFSVTYAGQALTPRVGAGDPTRPRAEIWTLVNPPAGTSNVVVTLSGTDQLAAGALSFTGVDTSTATSHLDVAPVASPGNNNGNTASVSITPATNNTWLVDTVSVNGGVTTTMQVLAGRAERWNRRVGGSITAAGSTLGPISPAAARTLRWTWGGGAQRWSQVAIALRPATSPQLVRWSEVIQ